MRPFAKLKEEHEKLVEQLCDRQTAVFSARLKELIAKVNKEIPEFNGVVSCNGSTWAVGLNYNETYMIPFIEQDESLIAEGEPKYPMDILHGLFDWYNGYGRPPKVSKKCDRMLREINEIVQFMGDARLHTLCEPEVTLTPIVWR